MTIGNGIVIEEHVELMKEVKDIITRIKNQFLTNSLCMININKVEELQSTVLKDLLFENLTK